VASSVRAWIRSRAWRALSPSVAAMKTEPSSSMSMRTPVSSWIARITLPPGPMTAPLFSGSLLCTVLAGAGGVVHLQRGNPAARPPHLEVHVPQVIFHAADIGEKAGTHVSLYQPHRHTRHR